MQAMQSGEDVDAPGQELAAELQQMADSTMEMRLEKSVVDAYRNRFKEFRKFCSEHGLADPDGPITSNTPNDWRLFMAFKCEKQERSFSTAGKDCVLI
jgi:hypothetical protein